MASPDKTPPTSTVYITNNLWMSRALKAEAEVEGVHRENERHLRLIGELEAVVVRLQQELERKTITLRHYEFGHSGPFWDCPDPLCAVEESEVG